MSDLVKNITDAELEALTANGVTLVDFWAPWCGPCKKMAPVLDELAAEYGERVKFAKINTDDHKEAARRFGIMSIPTFILFKDGKKIDQKAAAVPKATLASFIDQAL